jgi:hypothetical protein
MALNLSGTTGIVTGNIAALQVTTATIADANVTPGKLSQPMTLATAQNATGTSVDFTSIPSWAKRITVMFNGVSTNGTSNYQVQLGTGGSPTTSGYEVYSTLFGTTTLLSSDFTTGFGIRIARAAGTCSGQLVFANLSGNIWTGQYFMADRINGESFIGGGAVTLSGVLNLVRITTVGGANTFDAGSINIMYEG